MHSLAWQVNARFRLGEWDEALRSLEHLEELLGDRRSNPPRPFVQAFSIAAFILEVRGDRLGSDADLAVVDAIEDVQQGRSVTGPNWGALTMARRGRFDEAHEWVDRLRRREGRDWMLEARCELAVEEARWD